MPKINPSSYLALLPVLQTKHYIVARIMHIVHNAQHTHVLQWRQERPLGVRKAEVIVALALPSVYSPYIRP